VVIQVQVFTQVITILTTVPAVIPAAGSSTVTCINNVVAPVVPSVTDNCGECNYSRSTRNYWFSILAVERLPTQYPFTDCAGVTQNWVYTYTVSAQHLHYCCGIIHRGLFDDVVAPALPSVTDNCGNVLNTWHHRVITGTGTCGANDYLLIFRYRLCRSDAELDLYLYGKCSNPYITSSGCSSRGLYY
jgi:hypothetical protein